MGGHPQVVRTLFSFSYKFTRLTALRGADALTSPHQCPSETRLIPNPRREAIAT
jgi:hypothetical protein